ncbi:MAG: hypothetical protein FWG54_03295, partial [Bacteroidetes bacterium]|nr:hypothetical protein [Bacteroidota bacterium]
LNKLNAKALSPESFSACLVVNVMGLAGWTFRGLLSFLQAEFPNDRHTSKRQQKMFFITVEFLR